MNTEEILTENLYLIIRKYMREHLPAALTRMTIVNILTHFGKTLNSGEAKNNITRAIKELNYEYDNR